MNEPKDLSRPKTNRALPIAAAVLLVFLAAVFIALSAVTLPYKMLSEGQYWVSWVDQVYTPDPAELYVITNNEEEALVLGDAPERDSTHWNDVDYSRSILILAKINDTGGCRPSKVVWVGQWGNRVLILADRRIPLVIFFDRVYTECNGNYNLLVIPRDGLSGRVRFDLVDRVVPLVSIERDLP